MKILILVIIILATVLLTTFSSSCNQAEQETTWRVVKSPLTGRYYEVVIYNPGSSSGLMSMSEVSEEEYIKYRDNPKKGRVTE